MLEMTLNESSSSKVPYDLRPRKQIERRMMAHTLYLLAESGFPISTYRYAGFGAFFFVFCPKSSGFAHLEMTGK